MRLLYLLCVWLHLLAAVVWIGGTTFLTLVLVPVLAKADLGDRRGALLHHTGVRFRSVGWVALGTLVGTGILILMLRGVGWPDVASAAFWASGFGRLLAVKLVVVAIILALSLAHDFVVGPRATRLLRLDPTSVQASRLRRLATRMGRVNLVLALAVLVIAVLLVRGLP